MFKSATLLISSLLLAGAIGLPLDLTNTTSSLVRRSSKNIVTTCKTPKTFAMTFDDGPYIYEADLVAKLAEYGAKGTFFVNGNNWDCIYDQAEQLQKTYLAGHVIGSHTWEHVDISTITGAALKKDMQRVEVALKKILGIKPALFRPPYGSYNQGQLNVLASMGYTSVYWSFDDGDSTGSTPSQSEADYNTYVKSKPKTAIALNHETYKSSVETVIPYALELLSKKGYKMVTVPECLGITPYQQIYTTKMPKRDSTWHC